MTRYDDYPEHPLCGVPQEVLDVARKAMEGPVIWKDVDPDMANPIADSIVAAFIEAGYEIRPRSGLADVLYGLTLLAHEDHGGHVNDLDECEYVWCTRGRNARDAICKKPKISRDRLDTDG